MENTLDLKEIRKRVGWRQHEMATYLGIDRTTVARIERGGQGLTGPVKRLLSMLLESETVQGPGPSKRIRRHRGAAAISRTPESCV